MTPQLQQAIKLLQLSNVELTEFVEDELSQNPMLERDDGEPGGREQGEAPSAENASTPGDEEFDGRDSMDMTAAAICRHRTTNRSIWIMRTSGMTSIRATCLTNCAAGLKRPRRSDRAAEAILAKAWAISNRH